MPGHPQVAQKRSNAPRDAHTLLSPGKAHGEKSASQSTLIQNLGLKESQLNNLGFNGVSRQKSAALYHRGEGVAPISKIPPPPPSPSLSSPFFSPNPQRNLTLPAPLAVSSPTLLTLSLYSPTSVIGPDLGQGNFPLSLDSRCRKARDTRRRKARDTRRRKARDTRY